MDLRFLRVLLLVVLVAAACGAQQTAVDVGDASISRGDLLDALDEQGAITDGIATSEAAAQYLTTEIRTLLLQDAADRAGLDVIVDELNADTVFASIVAAEVEARVPDIREVATSSLTCSRHILVGTEDEATDLAAQLDDGADFAELAQEFSIDTGSGAVGGDLGCVPAGSFVPEFEAALAAGGFNEILGPVETQFGFHLIEKLPNEDVTDQGLIEAGLASAFVTQEDFDAWRSEVLEVGSVKVDPRYGEWDPVGLQVVPPDSTSSE